MAENYVRCKIVSFYFHPLSKNLHFLVTLPTRIIADLFPTEKDLSVTESKCFFILRNYAA